MNERHIATISTASLNLAPLPTSSMTIAALVATMLATVASPSVGQDVLPQESVRVEQVITIPQRFYIGDIVEARVNIRPTDDQQPVEPNELNDGRWVELHSVRLQALADESYDIYIQFTPYNTGTLTLPAIDLGTFQLIGLSIYVSSVLDSDEAELKHTQRQLIFPATRLLFALLFALVAGATALWALYRRWWRAQLHSFVGRLRVERPRRRIARTIRQLDARLEQISARQFYIQLVDDIRRYLSTRIGTDCMMATTHEIIDNLASINASHSYIEELRNLFLFGDLVKFANHAATPIECRQHLKITSSFVADVEHRLHHPEEQADVGTR